MYEINRRLIEREADRSFFDASRFFVFKFNASGYRVINALADDAFPRARFDELCESIRMSGEATDAFWQKCVVHGIIVERPVSVCGPADDT